MTRKSHQAAAVLTSGTVCLLSRTFNAPMGFADCIVALAVSAYAALVPDIDTCESYISHTLLGFFFLPIWILQSIIRLLARFEWKGRGVFARIARHTGHRGLSHYPLVWSFVFGFSWLLLTPLEARWGIPMHLVTAARIGAVSGIGSHILTDVFFGHRGVAIFAPFCNKKINLTSWVTGGTAEDISFVVFLILDFLVLKSLFL